MRERSGSWATGTSPGGRASNTHRPPLTEAGRAHEEAASHFVTLGGLIVNEPAQAPRGVDVNLHCCAKADDDGLYLDCRDLIGQ